MDFHSTKLKFGPDGIKTPNEDADYDSNSEDSDDGEVPSDQYAPSHSLEPALTTQATKCNTIPGPSSNIQSVLAKHTSKPPDKSWNYEDAMREWKAEVDYLGAMVREGIEKKVALENARKAAIQKEKDARIAATLEKRLARGRDPDPSTKIFTKTLEGVEKRVAFEKARKVRKQERDARIAAALKSRLARRRNLEPSTKIFTKALHYMKKPELQDLCWALGLGEDGTIIDLTFRIRNKVETNPELKESKRFAEIFSEKERRLND